MSAVKSGGRKRVWVIAVAAVAVVVLAIGLALFKPWLLFVDVRVDEELPPVAVVRGAGRTIPASPDVPSPSPTRTRSARRPGPAR